jgi:glycosidase
MNLFNSTIYSVFVRNHSEEASFKAVQEDLPRIAALGVNWLWLMPVYPIGREKRKGSLGSPYAIADYFGVNPEHGDLRDLRALIDAAHELGLQVMFDLVLNHTAPDSVLMERNPQWFWKKSDGKVGNRFGDWSDIVDLDYSNRGLWEYQGEMLEYWVSLGVDGFRCDVAPFLPLEFWKTVIERVKRIKPEVVFLSESVEPHFILDLRREGHRLLTDAEILSVFDIAYDYDIFPWLKEYLLHGENFQMLHEKIRQQEYLYPPEKSKLRFLENHDQDRIMSLVSEEQIMHWTVLEFMLRGTALLFAGQEYGISHRPDLFNLDPIQWPEEKNEIYRMIERLIDLKKDLIFSEGRFSLLPYEHDGVFSLEYIHGQRHLQVLVNPGLQSGKVKSVLPDGTYKDLLSHNQISIEKNYLELRKEPCILEYHG